MRLKTGLFLFVFLCSIPGMESFAQLGHSSDPELKLPGRYFELLGESIHRINAKLDANPEPTLASLEGGLLFAHFPHAVIIPAVLYSKKHPLNKHFGERSMLLLAERIGDFLVKENNNGHYRDKRRNDSDWDTYMWLEAYRLLKNQLGEDRRTKWAAAILENLQLLEPPLKKYQDYPWYNAPFIITSPNHYSIYASTLLVGGYVFNKPEWIKLATKVLHRFCVHEQTADGYWGEHSQAGPTTGYDYVSFTQISLYWEYTKDPEALKALRRSTDFHTFFTYPDGTPVETINDRNRYWGVSMWGHFGFSHFADGRRYAEFLSGFFPLHGDTASYGGDIQSLGRIAQDLMYYHEGPVGRIPQDKAQYAHQMKVEAGIRKTGPWVVTYSGIIAPPVSLNNFFLDRQGNFSVFNKKTGLIITGANSKRQPELATFTETIGKDSIHMPVESRLEMNDKTDKLSLAYNVFFASVVVPKPEEKKLSFQVLTFYKWGEAVTTLNLQLILKSGQEIETGTGKKVVLGNDKIEWGDAETVGVLKHHGWVLHLPPGMHFSWPVYPFNPYHNAPETELSKAIGRLSLPLELKDQVIPFEIEVNE
ncbi:MAG: hypothetical protein ABIY90_00875 [Puia sp.]